MAEELRLLYVAMTRAKEKLILSVALAGGERRIWRSWREDAVAASAAPWRCERQQSVGGWVLLHALARPGGGRRCGAWRGCRRLSPRRTLGPGLGHSMGGRGGTGRGPPEQRGRCRGSARRVGDGAGGRLTERAGLALSLLSWPSQTPSKLTATQLKGREPGPGGGGGGRPGGPPAARPLSIQRPRFVAEERGLTPAQRGTALHLAMQYLDFSGQGAQRSRAAAELAAPGGRAASSPPSRGRRSIRRQLSAFFQLATWAGR